ncbi:hypothetical protein OAJ89_05810 [Alphaproteobacteria bacterium]|nr:hypothetical protein [Alphaproteobacteria bacterium]
MKNKYPKNLHVTEPNLISNLYFQYMKKKIIEIGNFKEKKIILDYGAGKGELKQLNNKLNNKSTIINYDIIKELSDVDDWKNVKFDTIVFCQVLVLIEPDEIKKMLEFLRKSNSNLEIITIISSQSLLNKIGGFLLGHFDSHGHTKTNPLLEKAIFRENCEIIRYINYFNLFEIFKLKFKN